MIPIYTMRAPRNGGNWVEFRVKIVIFGPYIAQSALMFRMSQSIVPRLMGCINLEDNDTHLYNDTSCKR